MHVYTQMYTLYIYMHKVTTYEGTYRKGQPITNGVKNTIRSSQTPSVTHLLVHNVSYVVYIKSCMYSHATICLTDVYTHKHTHTRTNVNTYSYICYIYSCMCYPSPCPSRIVCCLYTVMPQCVTCVYTHTHTHTHTYIYIHMYVYVTHLLVCHVSCAVYLCR